MPNGTYGGVRGELNLPYSIAHLQKKCAETGQRNPFCLIVKINKLCYISITEQNRNYSV